MSGPGSPSSALFRAQAIGRPGSSMPGAIRPAWRAWWLVARFGLLVAGCGALLAVAAHPFVPLPWWKVFRRCASIAAAAGLWLSIRVFERRSFASYGLPPLRDGAGKRELCLGLLLGVTALGAAAGLGLATGVYEIAVTPNRLQLWRTLIGFLPAAILVGVLEEAVFRGFVLQHLLAASRSAAVLASSAAYAVVHLRTRTLDPGAWLELGGLFLLGLVLCLACFRTGRLSLAIGLHAALAYGARVNKLLIRIETDVPWLVGTNRLVNGLAGWAALLVLAAVLLWRRPADNAGGARDAGISSAG